MDQFERQNFAEFFSNASPDAIDFIDRLLVLDPDRRSSIILTTMYLNLID
jgi:hypothetical protein